MNRLPLQYIIDKSNSNYFHNADLTFVPETLFTQYRLTPVAALPLMKKATRPSRMDSLALYLVLTQDLGPDPRPITHVTRIHFLTQELKAQDGHH